MGLFGPVGMGGLGGVPGYGMQPLQSLPGMNIPYGYMGPDARPCGGYGGYDAATNEARRLMETSWNSVTTNNIHESYRGLNTSASMPDLPAISATRIIDQMQKLQAENQIAEIFEMRRQQTYEEGLRLEREAYRAQENRMKDISRAMADMELAKIQRQTYPETIFEKTGSSHFAYVEPSFKSRRPGWHETTYPGVGSKAGFSEQEFPSGYGIRTSIGMDKNGNLTFDVNY